MGLLHAAGRVAHGWRAHPEFFYFFRPRLGTCSFMRQTFPEGALPMPVLSETPRSAKIVSLILKLP